MSRVLIIEEKSIREPFTGALHPSIFFLSYPRRSPCLESSSKAAFTKLSQTPGFPLGEGVAIIFPL